MDSAKERKELDYMDFLQGVGVEKGDIIDVSSDMANVLLYCRRIGVRLVPDHLIDSLQELVGPEGTVMIRTFTWDFCHGEPFDIRTSPSRVGALGNAAMKRADFKRTGHPIYSWMVWGKRAGELLQMDQPNAFGPGSVFDFLDINHAKQLTLGNTSSDSTTQMHHVEAACKVPYRFDKPFTVEYTDYSGNTCLKTYSMHVRPLNLKVTNTEVDRDERGKELEKRGIMKVKHLDEMTLVSTILLHELTEFLTEDMYQNEGKFTVSINDLPGYVAAGIKPEELKFYAE